MEIEIPFAEVRGKLLGIDREEWLSGARLVVFHPRLRSRIERHFEVDDYTFKESRMPSRRESQEMTEIWQRIEAAVLAEDAGEDEVGAYVDLILSYAPRTIDSRQSKTLRIKLEALGAERLSVLLERLPVRTRLWFSVLKPTIYQMARDEHVPELVAAFRREPDLGSLLRRKKWLAAAAPVVAERLPKRDRILDYEEISIAASLKDPATYEDLAWHGIHVKHGHSTILREFSKLPGFPFERVVNGAWQRSRIELANEASIAPWAAKLGYVDAFRVAALRLEKPKVNDQSRQRYLKEMRAVVSFDGDDAALQSWLLANLGDFEFDDQTKRFVLR